MNDGMPDLGTCCICETTGPQVRNALMLPMKSPTPSKGWGCFACHLPLDGCTAVVCDACLEPQNTACDRLRFVCTGYAGEDGRTPIEEVRQAPIHEHDLRGHPEVAGRHDG